jgi:hypothetical protein
LLKEYLDFRMPDDRSLKLLDLWFFVLRSYRGRTRVLSMHDTEPGAEDAYQAERSKLRDGDLILARANLTIEKITSGGYNRTRW